MVGLRLSLKSVLWWLGAAVLATAGAALLVLRPLAVPTYEQVRAAYQPSAAYLLDRHGELLDAQRVAFDVRRLDWTPLPDISPALLAAVVEGEDRRFWQHAGVDWRGVASAARDAATGRGRRGASTITMQLAALLDPAADRKQGLRDSRQKLRQMRLAFGLELSWSKAQILEAYLNLLPYRGELQGVTAAAQVLAHKSPSGLTVAESRIVAALLPSPQAGAARVAQRACARIPASQRAAECPALQATAEQLLSDAGSALPVERWAPHLAAALLKQAGQSVRTTLDAQTQRLVLDALSSQLAGLGARNVRDGAALVVDNQTGDVLAYVGSGGPASRSAQVDGVRAKRQAGSTLKPFLYGMALERRYLTAASLIDDLPVNIDTPRGLYLPQDYDHDYKGAVSVRTALAGSLNVPAVRTLMLVGVEAFRARLADVGYAGISEDGSYYGYALALGSADVSLWEQAMAYRTLALGGRNSPLRLTMDEPVAPLRPVLSPASVFIVGDMLSDPSARSVTFGLSNSLATGYWAAVKTGTSKDMRDNWCVGYTPRYTVAVWVGNFEGDPMHAVSGVTGAAPVWRQIMDGLHRTQTETRPAAPRGVRRQSVRYASRTEAPRQEWFLEGTAMTGPLQEVSRDARSAHISSPVDGMVIALDPDIPAERQRLPLGVEGSVSGLLLKVDEQLLGQASEVRLWQPQTGVHRFSLEEANGRSVDSVVVTVR